MWLAIRASEALMRLTWVAPVLVLAILATALDVEAQPVKKTYRIGVLSPGASPPGPLEAFREGLRELGYVDGETVAIEWRFAEGKIDRLPTLADELVRLKVDVVFAVNTPAARAAKNATTTIPIVIARLADPVKTGLVPSIARPGGNITGLSSIAEEVSAKRLELLKETLPGVSRIALLFNPENPGHITVVSEAVRASTQLSLQLQTLGVRAASDLPEVFQAVARARAEALFVMDDVRITLLRVPILHQAAKLSLPVFAQYREFVEAGALIAFAHSLSAEYRQAAYYVDRILKGASPADLPIQQPTRFELIINARAAKALRLVIPRSVLLRADEMIE
jgi:putative ABC transport system substrate-binding protein